MWTQLGGDFNGSATFNYLAYSVSLSGDGKRLAIHAKGNGGSTWNGYERVYSESSGVWTPVGSDICGEAEEDRFGAVVSLSSNGQSVAIGAYYNDGTLINNPAWVFSPLPCCESLSADAGSCELRKLVLTFP